jgi:hypothetical protein
MAFDMGGFGGNPEEAASTAIELYRQGVPVRRILEETGLERASLLELLEAHGLRRGRSSGARRTGR